jgi:uncharacterized protein (TIGR03492 family)
LKLLALSNGHGEDEVAIRVLRQLQQQCPAWDLQAMPLVGEGSAYRQSNIEIYGPVQSAMPSGGFIYMDQQRVLNDLRSGLLSLTIKQLKACRQWTVSGGQIVAVGDIVPLLFAWWSKAHYAFIGTAKSEYYLRTDDSALHNPPQWPWQHWFNSDYLPWERSLLQNRRCKAVFPRDSLTAQFLKQWPIPAFDLGNPMLDDLEPKGVLNPTFLPKAQATILLLPGSRPPEAYANWQLMLKGITPLATQGENLVFIGAIATQLDFEPLQETAISLGWTPHAISLALPHVVLKLQQAHLIIVKQAFSDGLHLADVAIAMAGTATEQCVGFGKPVITLPGSGPQFTWAFAEAQTRLLGPSIHLLEHPTQIPATCQQLLDQPDRKTIYPINGQQRMGQTGASQRIASQLQKCFTSAD